LSGPQRASSAADMVTTDNRTIFTNIVSMARQICFVSEKAEKTGVLGGLDFMLLQNLSYAIAQQVTLVEMPSTSTPIAGSPPSSPPRAVDVKTSKRKFKQQQASEPTASTTSVTTAKRRRKEEASVTPVRPNLPSANTATSDDEPAKECLDCGRTKTNQWRSGPKGMSTLCNACGMRYTRRMKRQVTPTLTASNSTANSTVMRRESSVLDSPLCGHESDHSLSPVSSPLPFHHHHSSPMLDDSSVAPNHQQEKRSNLYTLLN
jgi:hypothetical protein